jgi:hypothetical protein
MGTRIPYVGTERELRQREREQARRAERSAAQASGAEEGMDEMVEDAAQ